MLAELKPYPEYKDRSEHRLWDALPTHWTVNRLRHAAELLVSNVDKHSHEGEVPVRLCNYVDVYKNRRITDRLAFMRATATPDEVHRFRIRVGDVLITKDSEAWNDIGVPALVEYEAPDLVCGYHLAILRPHADRLIGGYLLYALLAHTIAAQFHTEANGVTRYGLSHGAIKDILLPLPPPAEQAGIVRFLEAVDRKVNRFIRAKRRLIEVLTEQKQAIITHAVTKGLNPNVKFKPSGIDWLGDIPAHWEVKRLRHIIQGRLTYGANEAAVHDRTDWPRYLRITDFGGDGGLRGDTFRSLPPEIASDYMVQPGDILLARSGATVGKAFLVDERATNACHAGYLIRARPKQAQVDPRFLFLYTQSTAYSSWRAATFNIATIENIGADKYANLPVPLPPREEQDHVLKSLVELLKPIVGAADVARREIDLIREYRTRLIADVVTGKLDVRGFVPTEPMSADEPADEPIEEVGLDDEEAELVEEAVDAAD